MKRVRMLRDLDGFPAGTEADMDDGDADRLIGFGSAELIEAKQAPAPANTARRAPANKARRAPANKSKAAR